MNKELTTRPISSGASNGKRHPSQLAELCACSPQEMPISTLVPGDIVYLSAGDMIPADVRLLSAKDLFVSQAMLTGESIPLEKHAVPPTKPAKAADASQSVLAVSYTHLTLPTNREV